jgi:hypothetical protein
MESDGKRMLKVMLIGDSIRLSYQERLKQKAGERASILSPADNCRFSAYTLFCLTAWAPEEDYDVIQWNNGQWDTCYMPDGRIHTPLPLYVELQKRIAGVLQGRGKRLIFATTTPVRPEQFLTAARNGRKNEDIRAYNEAATRELTPMGVEINDLHTPLAEDISAHIGEDKVHLTPAGIERCATLVHAKFFAGGAA